MKTRPTVTAYVSTKDRYFTTLPMCLTAVAMQTVKPQKLIIYDDGEHKDLRESPLYQNIFAMFDTSGIEWTVIFGAGKGQVLNHQKALETATTEWIWRLDDDNVAENRALEKMLDAIDDKTGAVGGLVLHPTHMKNVDGLASNAIEDVWLGLNIQWYKFEGIREVDHLYSTFIYRKEAGKHGYCMDLSPVGHHEETMFSYGIKRAGWKVKVQPEAITWHLRDSKGGIRSYNDPMLWENDKAIFKKKLDEWGVVLSQHKIMVLDSGLGDHLNFKPVLQEILEKYPEKKIILAVCYPEVFKGIGGITMISIADAKAYFGNLDQFNVYKYMWDNNWKRPMQDAYRRMYL